ncbi:phospholipid:diacylglycerol acyltransferase, partial [Conglomerata obtusa]
PTKTILPHAPDLQIFCLYGIGISTERGYYYTIKNGELRIDRKINNEKTKNGIILCDGDGTVPTFSCGYLGYRGWKNKNLNPSGIKSFVKEYSHEKITMGLRGGPYSSDHVDILGNYSVIEDILKICCGKRNEIEENIISNLEEMCDKIDGKKVVK